MSAKTAPAFRPEPDGSNQPDILAEVNAETWLANRLLQHGHDIYAWGPYATYADRLGACIARNSLQCVIVGRNAAGRPESYGELFRRLYGRDLPKVPRSQHQTSKVTTC